MTTTETAVSPTATTTPRGNRWAPTFRGVGLATRIELIRRRPTPKGWVFYGLILLAMVGIALAVAATAGPGAQQAPLEMNILMVLGIGILVSTSLAATSINGDSTEGVLAPLQMTRLTAGDIAIGKLLSSWLVSVMALVSLSPFLIYAYTRSTWEFGEFLIVVAAILFVVLVSTAIGLAWSSIAARSIASVSLAHITVGALMVGTVVLYFMTQPLVGKEYEVTNRYQDWGSVTEEQWNDPNFDPSQIECVEETRTIRVAQTEKIAWMLLINPFVTVSETAPLMDEEDAAAGGNSLFGIVHMSVSSAQKPIVAEDLGYNDCVGWDQEAWEQENLENALATRNPWVGLAFNTALLLGSMVLTINRLRVPYNKLRGGTRVA